MTADRAVAAVCDRRQDPRIFIGLRRSQSAATVIERVAKALEESGGARTKGFPGGMIGTFTGAVPMDFLGLELVLHPFVRCLTICHKHRWKFQKWPPKANFSTEYLNACVFLYRQFAVLFDGWFGASRRQQKRIRPRGRSTRE